MKVVFDLDGTLANAEKRVNQYLVCPKMGYPHKRVDKIDWDAFFEACDEDEPIVPNLAVLHALYDAGHKVEIWTGRSDMVRVKTEQWLLMHGVPQSVIASMRMRPYKDHQPDDTLKSYWMDIAGTPDLVFEDRDRVIKMYREAGVTVHQVAPGAF